MRIISVIETGKRIAAGALFLGLLLGPTTLHAQKTDTLETDLVGGAIDDSQLPAVYFEEAPLVSPGEAKEVLRLRGERIRQRTSGGNLRSIEDLASPEISTSPMSTESFSTGGTLAATGLGAGQYVPSVPELARALRNDVDVIFEYVYNNIDYVPMWGLQKGAEGALLDGSGTAFDIAELMVELLRASGYTADYVVGTARFQENEIEAWFNIPEDKPIAIATVIGSGGIPGTYYTTGGGLLDAMDMGHVWVRVNIGGTNYYFDPGFKQYTYHDPIDIATASGYSQSELMTAAGTGANITSTFVQDVNREGVRDLLDEYSSDLVTYIKQNHPAADVIDILGGRELILIEGPVRNTSIPHQAPSTSTEVITTDLPEDYKITVEVKVGNPSSPYIDEIFYSDEIYARRLTLRVNSSLQASLVLDGTVLDTGSSLTAGSEEQVTFVIDHPYAASGGAYVDQTRTQTFTVGADYTHLVVAGFGYMARGAIEKYREAMRQGKIDGFDAEDEPIIGSAMGMLAATWMAQNNRASQMQDILQNNVTVQHHVMGLAGYAGSPYIDLKAVALSATSLDEDNDKQKGGLAAYGGVASALEGTAISQTQGVSGLSTVQLLDIAVQTGGSNERIYDATLSNFSSIQPNLNNYSAGELATVQSYLNAGYRVILPRNGNLTEGSYSGIAFIGINSTETGYGYIISGGLKGGFSSTFTNPANIETVVVTAVRSSAFDGAFGSSEPVSWDPITLVSGNYILPQQDLSIGSAAQPIGLGFTRSYTSGASKRSGPLGYGWASTFDIKALPGSDGYQGMGEDSPIDAASAIVAMYISLDLMTGTKDLDEVVTVSLVQRWLADRLTDNVVTVDQPGAGEQFVKLADGSYNPPPGSASTLSVETDGSYRYTAKNATVLDFNTDGLIEAWNDRNSNTLTFNYTSGKLSSVANDFGRTLTLGYTGDKLTSVSDGEGRTVSYAYDTDGNLVTFTDAAGEDTVYEYDEPGRMTKVFYPDRPTLPYVTNVYDTLGRVMTQISAAGDTYEYFIAGTRTDEDDPLGNTTTRYFDSHMREVLLIDKLGQMTQTEYDGEQRAKKKILPGGNSIEYSYDSRHNVTQITANPRPCSPTPCTDPSSLVQSFTYDTTFNQVQTATDVLSRVTTNTYNLSNGNLLETELPEPETSAGHPTITYTYNGAGQLLTVTDPTGIVTRNTYDGSSGDVLTTTVDYGTGRLNLQTVLEYDNIGNRTNVTDPEGNETVSMFDDMRRITQVTAPSPFNFVTQIDYDEMSRVVETRVETGISGAPWQTTTTTYSPGGRVATVTDPQGHITTMTYDELDRLDEVTDAEGRKSKNVYDAMGRVLVVKRGLGTALAQDYRTSEFDENGLLMAIEDAKGNRTEYQYDVFDRLKKTLFPSKTTAGQVDASDYEVLTYDNVGNVLSRRNRANQVIEFDYDNLNRVTEVATPGAPTVTTTYDMAGRVLTQVDSDGQSLAYDYDTAGRLEDVATNHTSSGPTRTVAYLYDDNGKRTRVTWPDSYYVTYEYDQLNRLTAVKENGTTTLATYGYDDLSRRVLLTLGNGAQTTYAYEIDNDMTDIGLTAGSGFSLSFAYGHDNTHLITSVDTSDAVFGWAPPANDNLTYTANGQNQYTTVESVSATYDAKGNLTGFTFGGNAHAYTYDALNRLTATDTPVDDATYAYDPVSRRSSKTVNSDTTDYLSDGQEEIAEYDRNTGDLLRRYVYGPGIDERIALVDAAGNRQYYQVNHQGSTIAVTDDSGDLAETFRYNPWGSSSDGLTGNPYRYTGRRLDEETGLYYYRARYYSPELGRFLQPDPVGYRDHMNLYGYVQNSPISFRDPNGLSLQEIADFFSGITISKDSAFSPIVGGGISIAATGGGPFVEASGGVYSTTTIFEVSAPGVGSILVPLTTDMGVFLNYGAGVGVGNGGDVFVGVVPGDINDLNADTVNGDFSAGPVSVALAIDPLTGAFSGITIGRGFGTPVSGAATYSSNNAVGLSSVFDAVDWISSSSNTHDGS